MREFIKHLSKNLELDRRICFHTYNDLLKTDVGKRRLETYLDRWIPYGFIEGIEEDRQEEIAFYYEQLAIFLLSRSEEDDKEYCKDFSTVAFPMTRRISIKLKKGEFNFFTFLKYLKEIDLNGIMDLINEINPYEDENGNLIPYDQRRCNFDNEAEVVFIVSEMIVELFENPEANVEDVKKKRVDKLVEHLKEKIKEEDTK